MRSYPLGIAVAVFAMSTAGWAQDSAAELVEQGNKALVAGDHAQSLHYYEQAAQKMPDSAEIDYNQGVVYYRKGEYDKAEEAFAKALRTRDLALDAKARFNLGNCAYAQALAKQGDLKAAIEKLRTAIGHYRQAIDAQPQDGDARTNIEMAQLLIKDLMDREKRRQEEQKEQDQDKKDEENQDQQKQESSTQPSEQQEPQSQPSEEQPQTQPGEQQQQDQQKKEDQQAKQDKQGGQQDQADQQQGADDEKKQAGKPDQDGEKKEDAQAVPATQQAISKDEAEKLLQMVRDKEQRRGNEQSQRIQVIEVPVDRDW